MRLEWVQARVMETRFTVTLCRGGIIRRSLFLPQRAGVRERRRRGYVCFFTLIILFPCTTKKQVLTGSDSHRINDENNPTGSRALLLLTL